MSEFKDRCFHFYAQVDGTYDWPNSAAGDLLKIGFKEIEQLEAHELLLVKGRDVALNRIEKLQEESEYLNKQLGKKCIRIEELEGIEKTAISLNSKLQTKITILAKINQGLYDRIEQIQAKVNQWEQWWFDMCDSTCEPPYHPDSYPQPPEDENITTNRYGCKTCTICGLAGDLEGHTCLPQPPEDET